MGPGLHTLSYLAICLHPPYPILVVAYIFVGYGHGLLDAAWNAWLSNMANANEMMGFLHGFYGLGATLGPLVATSLIAKVGWPWYAFYYFMLGGSFIELAVLTASFWKETGKKHSRAPGQKKGQTREALTHRVPWTVAIFLLGYVGAEVALGGWLVTFMMRVRGGAPFESGMTVVGFWMGLTVGRVILGFVTGKIGERLAVIIYFIISMGLELLFWLVPRFHVSAVAVAFLGFFLGPLFPAAIVVATKLLPKHLHISAIGFAAACGGGGAALFPFAVGAIAERAGVQVLQPIVLGLLAVLLGIWLTLPRIKKHQSHST
ncbi:MAG: hypothetical protein M1823_002042 [Watsoniomyces obsoletus]|nr:MAG: hypothetical protein M1823_002042 [Watsoniomyces obsoletus]